MAPERKTKRGFTLIELMVAVGLLTMVLGFTGVIFKVSIESQRLSAANAEIMRKLRAITSQLNSDFKGLRKDAPLYIWFDQEVGLYDLNRYDQIMFFANGDFQSTQLYDYGKTPIEPSFSSISGSEKPVVGNLARIYYGQARVYDLQGGRWVLPWDQNDVSEQSSVFNERARVLARRQHIVTFEKDFQVFPVWSGPNAAIILNDTLEHDTLSLAGWKANTLDIIFNDGTIRTCFGNRPGIDLKGIDTLHMLMAQGVGSFKIQWAYWDAGVFVDPCLPDPEIEEMRWFPDEDPDGSNLTLDSHFGINLMNRDRFGVGFNDAGIHSDPKWYPINEAEYKYVELTGEHRKFTSDFYPKALKFTFRLYDSHGLIEEQRDGIRKKGRTFTHIVYLD